MNPIPKSISFPFRRETESLSLRSPDDSDPPLMLEAIAESFPELNRWLPWAKAIPTLEDWTEKNRASAEKFRTGSVFTFRIYNKQSNVFLGVIAIKPDDTTVPSFELGYWLRSAYSRKGLMTEALTEAIDFAHTQLLARRVQARTDETNIRSWRILERLGFRQEGVLRGSARNNLGKLVNLRVYAKCFSEEK